MRPTSMRPAQKAPENFGRMDRAHSDSATSMRPAQKAPENEFMQGLYQIGIQELQ